MEDGNELDVSLRPFERTDFPDLMAWTGDDRVAQSCRWDALKSRDEARSFLAGFLISHPWARAICLDGRPIGHLTFKQGTDVECCRGEMGYALAYEHWGKGITTQAVKMAVSAIFRELVQVERIDAVVTDTNIGSQRVLEKAGFVKEGLLRNYRKKNGKPLDMIVYSILAFEQKQYCPLVNDK